MVEAAGSPDVLSGCVPACGSAGESASPTTDPLPPDLTFHALRHTYACCVSRPESHRCNCRFMGHAKVTTTLAFTPTCSPTTTPSDGRTWGHEPTDTPNVVPFGGVVRPVPLPAAPDGLHQRPSVDKCRILKCAPDIDHLRLGEDALSDDGVVDELTSSGPSSARAHYRRVPRG